MFVSPLDSHRETLKMLEEVRAYIARLPDVPMNREMLAKIENHIEDPTQHLALTHKPTRKAGVYTPAGLPLITAELKDEELTLKISEAGSSVRDAKILRELRKGLKLTLKLG